MALSLEVSRLSTLDTVRCGVALLLSTLKQRFHNAARRIRCE